MDRTVSDPMIGRVLDGRYRIGPRIARGGMATVYEAMDERLDRLCAVKVMHQGMGDDEQFSARFVREARSAARLSHPSVVSVFDQGDDDGILFLVMEFIPGNTLRDLIRAEAPLKPTRALAVLDQVLGALAAAHASSMIHRDVKPENVLLAPDGRVKVADFGLARAISAETQHTATGGVLIGTVSYLAPELVAESKADARSDVYAAGVILYEMLTGKKPHEGETPIQVAYKHVHEDVPPPSALVPEIPAYLDALVARATARDRDQRPSDARALQQLLRRVRTAVDTGVVDDPDLVTDLMPRASIEPEPGIDYNDESPTLPVTLPAALAAEHGREHTSVIGEEDFAGPALAAAAAATGFVEHPSPPSSPGPPPSSDWAPAPPVTPPTGSQKPRRPKRGKAVVSTGPAGAAAAAPGMPGRQYRRSRRGPVLLSVVLILAVAAALGGWYLGVGRYTSVPQVAHLSEADARAEIEKAGLSFEVSRTDYSEDDHKDAVISTNPSGGDRIRKGGTVKVVVSLGPERYKVPKLRGSTVDEAQEKLAKRNLDLGDVRKVYHEKLADGLVIRSTPAAGFPLAPDSDVILTVSKGPKPIKIGDYTDRRPNVVTAELDKLGLDVTTSQDYSETIAKGRIMSQTPGSGATLYRGDTVNLVISQGPPLVEVPNVVTKSEAEARQMLRDAGFKVKVEKPVPIYIGLDYVHRQDPGAGQMYPKGTTVTIYLV